MATKNRRRHLRTKAQNLVAHLRVGDRTILAPVDDISMGGVFLRTSEAIAHGTMLAFDVARPGLKRPLRLMGLVVDTRNGRGVGLRFNGLDPETNDRLSDLMRDLGGIVGASLADPPDPPPQRASTQPAQHQPPQGQHQGQHQRDQQHPQQGRGAPTPAHPVTSPFAQPTQTGNFAGSGGTDEASRLMVQLRGAIMEIGNLQQQMVQKDRELAEMRNQLSRGGEDARAREAAESIVGKLEMEKMRLQEQLAASQGRTRGDVDAIKREAEAVIQAMGRLIEALKRLG